MINYGQCIFLGLVLVELALFIVYLGIKSVELDQEERNQLANRCADAYGWCFFSLSFALFLAVYYLISRLQKMRDMILARSPNMDNRVFNEEICALLAILLVFSSTYIMRGLFDINVDMKLLKFISMLS